MLYKVTPLLTPPDADPAAPRPPREARKRRKSAVFDAEGHEVLITMMCLKCRQMKPLGMFGLRKMADGAIRNQPWCRGCRSGASAIKKKPEELEPLAAIEAAAPSPPVRTEPVPSQSKGPLSPLEQLMAGPSLI